LVTQPTRVGGTSRNGSILDLVFCNDSNFVHNANVTAPFSSSDHCSVEFDIIHYVKIVQADVSSYDFSKADWVSIASFLDNDNFFNLFQTCVDVRSIVNNFYSLVFDAFNRSVPLRNCHKAHGQSHYPNKIHHLISRKVTAWKQYRTFRTQELLANYKAIASKCRLTIYSYHVDVENKVINSDNINKFYRYANRKFTNKSPIGPLKSNDGSTIIDPTRKAQLLQTILTSMFITDNGHIPVVSTTKILTQA